jgi:hypothetical protein
MVRFLRIGFLTLELKDPGRDCSGVFDHSKRGRIAVFAAVAE